MSARQWALWTFWTQEEECRRRAEAWAERQYLRHALVAALTHDQQVAEQANAVFAKDKPPPDPWAPDTDDERWSERRLEADLLMGKSWPFFRDKRLDGPATQEQESRP